MVGFASFFRIPGAFLSVNMGTMFSAGSELFFPFLLVFWVFFTSYFIMPRREHPIAEKWLVILPVVAVELTRLVLFERHWREWVPSLLPLVVVAIFYFRRTAPPHLSFGDRRLSRYTVTFQRLIPLYIFTWIALTVSHDAGRAAAIFQQEYLVPTNGADSIVLTSFGDNLIVATFDRKTKEVERGFSILKKGEDPKLILRWERVGPLHLKPQPQFEPPPTGTQPASQPPTKELVPTKP